MDNKQRQVKAREIWISCYQQLGSVSKAARKCGIPRSTLYRWVKRYKADGKEGLQGHSKRPKSFGNQKVNQEMETLEVISKVRDNVNS